MPNTKLGFKINISGTIMAFISLPSGYIINLNQIALIKPDKEGKSIDIIFSTGTAAGNSQLIKSHWLTKSFTGDSAISFLNALDKEGVDTSFTRSFIK